MLITRLVAGRAYDISACNRQSIVTVCSYAVNNRVSDMIGDTSVLLTVQSVD